jgi:hypothetical protein
MTEPVKDTKPPGRDEQECPASAAMGDRECAAIRQVGADDAPVPVKGYPSGSKTR